MEAAHCTTSNGEVKDVTFCLNRETEGILSPNVILRNELNLLNENNEVKTKSIVNGMSESPVSFESPKITEGSTQKSVSPTLFEHALNVMKNLFSPDKNKNKSPNVFSSSNPSDQSGLLNSFHTPDFHNNTNDSFFTTVSRIDESFQSAVSYLDENGKANENMPFDIFNCSQNSDLFDSGNQSQESSRFCLENTVVKNTSPGSEKNEVESISGEENPQSIVDGPKASNTLLFESESEILASNEDQAEFCPIDSPNPSNLSTNSLQKDLSRLSMETISEVSKDCILKAESPDQTFEKESKSSSSNEQSYEKPNDVSSQKLNQTYEKGCETPSQSDDRKTEQPETIKLNETYSAETDSPIPDSDKTFIKKSESSVPNGMNRTYDKKQESSTDMDKTFDISNEKNSEELNTTFDLKVVNKTFEKEPEVLITSSKQINESVISPKNSETAAPRVENSLPSEPFLAFENANSNRCRDVLNNSFVSTTSSNASLSNNENSTIFPQESRVVDDLAVKLGTMNINEEIKTEIGTQDWGEAFLDLPKQPGDLTDMIEDKFSLALKDERLSADAELARLIQEQFSSTDIEKICSVVDDIPTMKTNSEILKATEQSEKSCEETSSSDAVKSPKIEPETEKISDLTPHSLDYLNSIKGKPTGRDLSRESLYVKFDPLVQPPNANSLIDFTKEVEPVATTQVPTDPEVNKEDVCEQLLSISVEKKTDEIVPPLTPLSSKTNGTCDKGEKLKGLQNEIYFLRNLYNEKERSNKAKAEEFETQIARLTGQNCVFEDKLKESTEREKILVKKVNVQKESINQLKVVLDEYVKFLEKVSLEREAMKVVNAFRQQALKADSTERIDTLGAENDPSYKTRLESTEAPFLELYERYENSKKIIMDLKMNEISLKNATAEQVRELKKFQEKADEAQAKASREFQEVQKELDECKANHRQETTRLKAHLRKTELQLRALQNSLGNKTEENAQLAAIRDDLIKGKR